MLIAPRPPSQPDCEKNKDDRAPPPADYPVRVDKKIVHHHPTSSSPPAGTGRPHCGQNFAGNGSIARHPPAWHRRAAVAHGKSTAMR
jgi:hypothetical protein